MAVCTEEAGCSYNFLKNIALYTSWKIKFPLKKKGLPSSPVSMQLKTRKRVSGSPTLPRFLPRHLTFYCELQHNYFELGDIFVRITISV